MQAQGEPLWVQNLLDERTGSLTYLTGLSQSSLIPGKSVYTNGHICNYGVPYCEDGLDIFKLGLADSCLLLIMSFFLQAVNETSPELFTIATLTGHAIRAMGPHYSVSTALNTSSAAY